MSIPMGDPASMRAAAASFRAHAEGIASVAETLDSSVQALVFEGPAATEFLTAMSARRYDAEQLAARLQDLSAIIQRAATDLEQAQREARRQEQEW